MWRNVGRDSWTNLSASLLETQAECLNICAELQQEVVVKNFLKVMTLCHQVPCSVFGLHYQLLNHKMDFVEFLHNVSKRRAAEYSPKIVASRRMFLEVFSVDRCKKCVNLVELEKYF